MSSKYRGRWSGLSAAVLAMAWAGGAHAQSEAVAGEDKTVEELVVFGRAEQRIGQAVAASEGAIAGADLTVRPLLRTAELLESVPGMIVTQHSGSGKANQYFLRGFNLDHGTDFGFFIDDVPMNFRTHGHGQGYLDVNGMITDTVRRVDYRKGPYRADVGDFALVGMANASTHDTFDAPFVNVELGRFDFSRFVAGGSFKVGAGDLLLAGETGTYDGPWQLGERFRPWKFFGKYTQETPVGTLRISLSTYNGKWRPTEQIPERAIGTLVEDEYGALDLDLRGKTERQILTARLNGDNWRGTFYLQHYDWSMTSNFTFFLDNPVTGDELEQAEKLWTWGGRLERTFDLSDTLALTVGTDFRYDDIENVGLYHTIGGVRDSTTTQFTVDEKSGSLYAEAKWSPTEQLSVVAGLRGDAFRFKTRGTGGDDWSGKVSDDIVSPKIGAQYEVAPGIALYGNWGRGFHSNDSRGVTNPDSPAPGLVKATGKEVGMRFERYGLVATANYWWMEVDSELIYVGDAGSVEPSSASRRRGYELTYFWRPTSWLALDGVWTHSKGRFKDSPGAAHIPGALENAGELGGSVIFGEWNAGMRVRYIGAHPLIEDNSIRSESTTVMNLRGAWTPGRWEVFAELLNVFDSRDKDVEYFYTSRLPGEPLEGVDDLHSRAVEPRMIRAGLKVSF